MAATGSFRDGATVTQLKGYQLRYSPSCNHLARFGEASLISSKLFPSGRATRESLTPGTAGLEANALQPLPREAWPGVSRLGGDLSCQTQEVGVTG